MSIDSPLKKKNNKRIGKKKRTKRHKTSEIFRSRRNPKDAFSFTTNTVYKNVGQKTRNEIDELTDIIYNFNYRRRFRNASAGAATSYNLRQKMKAEGTKKELKKSITMNLKNRKRLGFAKDDNVSQLSIRNKLYDKNEGFDLFAKLSKYMSFSKRRKLLTTENNDSVNRGENSNRDSYYEGEGVPQQNLRNRK